MKCQSSAIGNERKLTKKSNQQNAGPELADKAAAVVPTGAASSAAGYNSYFGTSDKTLAFHLTRQLASVVSNRPDEDVSKSIELGLTLQRAIQPKDELEALLAAQMVSVHNLAMTCMGRANAQGLSTDGVRANIEWANKLMRTFTAQIETLNRHRGKGQQKVTVEHVTVNQGGQAMIGVVEKAGGGGGDAQN